MVTMRVDSMDADNPFQVRLAGLQPLLRYIAAETFGDIRPFPDYVPDREPGVAAFRRHVAAVREGLPAGRLLVFDVRQGWEPLCEFLGADPPRGEPFPRLNDAEAVRRRLAELDRHQSSSTPSTSAPSSAPR
ncbi:hypothetical protein ITP53_31545 [Nonomuraea sp. K274]|uniref:Uncharacterized protein n=1 Tax=Nonomuraea cypriaca TaxID=1187855 RepID=A0A931AE08_9ACTN|nr:sulfotransferase [Nonomuraea cypriaca]MBF8190183.1 hypothetical protein [Nonomuraea cypriaca]